MSFNNINIPEGFDEQFVKDWVGDQEVLAQEHDDSTFCVLLEDNDDGRVLKQFIRFFVMGGKTNASVDWDERWASADEKLFDIMFARFTR